MKIELADLAGGAVGERFNIDVQKVFANIADPNTEWKKARSLTVTLTFHPDENRDLALVDIATKTSLAPAKGIATKVILGMDRDGRVVGAELKSGAKDQMMIDNDGEVADDKGNKVSYLQQKSQGGK